MESDSTLLIALSDEFWRGTDKRLIVNMDELHQFNFSDVSGLSATVPNSKSHRIHFSFRSDKV
jgi:hypothetical protein